MEYCLTEMWTQQMTNRRMLKSLPGQLMLLKKKKQFQRVCVCVPNCLVNNIGCPLAPSEG